MSLTGASQDARQLYVLLEQINEKLQQINSQTGAATLTESRVRIIETRISINEMFTLLTQSLTLLRRMGLGPDMTEVVVVIQRVVMLLRQMRLAMLATQAALGPVGWAMLGVSLAGVAITSYELVMAGDQVMRR